MSATTKTSGQRSQTFTSNQVKCAGSFAAAFPRRVRLACGLLLLALSASAVAQTHICIGGDLDAMNATDVAACQAKMTNVRDAIKKQGSPAGWHFVVVCDEAGWKDYTSFSRQEAGLLSGASYSTDPRLRWTFLRGSNLDAEQPQSAARLVSAALNTLPGRQTMPQFAAPKNARRQFGIAKAEGGAPTLPPQ